MTFPPLSREAAIAALEEAKAFRHRPPGMNLLLDTCSTPARRWPWSGQRWGVWCAPPAL